MKIGPVAKLNANGNLSAGILASLKVFIESSDSGDAAVYPCLIRAAAAGDKAVASRNAASTGKR